MTENEHLNENAAIFIALRTRIDAAAAAGDVQAMGFLLRDIQELHKAALGYLEEMNQPTAPGQSVN